MGGRPLDLYIQKDEGSFKLSSFGLNVWDIKTTNAPLEVDRTRIKGKNGYLFKGATATEKIIRVEASYYARNVQEDEDKHDTLNALFAGDQPFYVTKMFPPDGLYQYERPGQFTTQSLVAHEMQKYRNEVLLMGDIEYDFRGKSHRGLLTHCVFTFVTPRYPFGMTMPCDEELTGASFISYCGTAPCSQLEWPWFIEIQSTESQGSQFVFTLGQQAFKYHGTRNIVKGDKFILGGMYFTLNGLNINDQTNTPYFELPATQTGQVSYSCDLLSQVFIRNKVEFYR